MAIVYPTDRKEVVDRIATDVQNEIDELTPQLRNSIIRALIIGFGGRFFDIYTQLKEVQRESFPDTATILVFLQRWGLFKKVNINPASPATGIITATGVVGSIIPEGTLYDNEAGNQYETIDQDYLIATEIDSVVANGLTRSGTIVTAQLSVDHNFASGILVTIAGAIETEYNGAFIITVVSKSSFTYQILTTPSTPATGTITTTSDVASVTVQSVGTGETQNLSSGADITLDAPIAGVDDSAFVQFTNISGGTDEETNEEYRSRILDAYANPISNSNDSDVIRVAQEVPGVTRVWVFDATPEPGEFETYFTRDNDEIIIPDANEIQQVKDKILLIKPAPMDDDDVHVFAPSKVAVDFQFISLVPDSQALREAIANSLKAMFSTVPQVSINLSENAYTSAIWTTINPETGEFVESFMLNIPSGDIGIAHGELAVLGSIDYL